MVTTIFRGVALVLLVAFNAVFLASGLHIAKDAASHGSDDGTKIYIVFTARQPAPEMMLESALSAKIESFHHSLLSEALDVDGSRAADRVVYHYTRSMHGFAARLTQQEKNKLAAMDDVVSVHEKVVYWPQTTRSWDFLGLPQHNDAERLPFEKDVIIGMVDSGIWPEADSFSDEGLPPPPSKWKGVCSNNFTICNNKIIGARAYKHGITTLSPRDDDGHGTHTASTAAGRPVPGASMGGLASGTARSAVPGARLAIYKVCWSDGCSSPDIMAAIEDAISDGVDVLSVSLGQVRVVTYAQNLLAVAAFHAMKRGIVTSVAVGNGGPFLGTASNIAPWTVSVAASTTDRKIVSDIILGNGKKIAGSAITLLPDLGKSSVLIDPGECGLELQGKNYKGAILLCGTGLGVDQDVVLGTGADGAIMAYDRMADIGFSYVFLPPTLNLSCVQPDISAPGVNILAAWPRDVSVVSESTLDHRQYWYNIDSGTSMACPHVSSVAAYIKSAHPDWSPAALVTTATPMSASTTPEAELAYGAGQVNPVRATYPGLVYDASEDDYLGFLCAQGYNKTQIAIMGAGKSGVFVCPDDSGSVTNLNYPSITVPVLNYGVRFAMDVPRTVTNVGPVDSNVTSVPGITVSVKPQKLVFSASVKKMNFTVSVSGSLAPVKGKLGASAFIVWSDGRHQVRSPIYVFPLSVIRG
ncbi:unnamed protein product [Alopecurus aequalis]